MRVAVVTGSTSSIGRAVCRQLVSDGRRVVAFHPGDWEAAERLKGELGIKTVQCEVDDAEACSAAVSEVETSVGAIDILVNGTDVLRSKPFHHMTPADWHEVVTPNLHSLYNMCRPVVPGMRDRGFGRIINISSVAGQMGRADQSSYCAAKAGVLGFTRALALEGARHGVTANAVAPGDVEEDERPEESGSGAADSSSSATRRCTPREVARCIGFLADEASRFITGETLSINGGCYMS